MKNGYSLAMAIGIGLSTIMFAGCGTSDGTLREGGRSESYIMGFHDGRHTGMKEAGNYLEHIVQDTQRFEDEADYKAGWLAGEAEGIRMQEQANAASNSYNAGKAADKAGPHPHDAMEDAMKGVNTNDLKVLQK